MNRAGAASRFLLSAMAVLAVAATAKAAAGAPPELDGLIARDIPGVSASPARTWAVTTRVLSENGVPVPAGATWDYLPYDTQVGGVALARENRVLIDPFTAAGDGRDLALVMAHEAAHLASHATQTRARGEGDPLEEAAAETVARDLYPVIRHRLRVDQGQLRGAYQQQVSWLRRATTRGCRTTQGGTTTAVERCARHTRRWFITASDTDRIAFATRWATGRIPGVEWANPWPARTIAQQLLVERRRWVAERRQLRGALRARYRKDVNHALALSSIAFGVNPDLLRRIAFCESSLIPGNGNGTYEGLFAFGLPLWNGTGFHWFSRYDPYAASLAAAKTISNGGISHWYPSRACWGGR